MYTAVVGQPEVGDPFQPGQRLLLVHRQRLVASIAARHHEGLGESPFALQEKMMQRRVGQQRSERPLAGSQRLWEARIRPAG